MSVPDDHDDLLSGVADVLRSLERAVAVAKRRRRFRLGLALMGVSLLGALVVLVAMLLTSG
jgi:hypothetical protein